MKKQILISLFPLVLISCSKDLEGPTGPPNPPEPIITDSNQIDSNYNLAGQLWIITAYRVGEFGNVISSNDVLQFLNQTSYTYNGSLSTYSFIPTASAYNLTLNFTPYGNISGTIYQGNLDQGVISGLKFTDITMGSGNETNYYLWMTRQ